MGRTTVDVVGDLVVATVISVMSSAEEREMASAV
jgi:Na+/H+-dicarboxylate symporter